MWSRVVDSNHRAIAGSAYKAGAIDLCANAALKMAEVEGYDPSKLLTENQATLPILSTPPLAWATGIEPAMPFGSALKGRWLYQFAYTHMKMVVRGGLEPPMFLMCRVYSPVPSPLSGT